MAQQPRPWYLAGQATVDSTGAATVTITMPAVGVYDIDTVSVSLSDHSTSASAFVYRDAVSQIHQIDATSRGGGDTSNTPHHLYAGQSLLVVWSGATPGTTAAAVASGLYTPEG